MSYAAADDTTPSHYESIADELDLLAQSARRHPKLSDAFAQRLHELAQQLRDDIGAPAHKSKIG